MIESKITLACIFKKIKWWFLFADYHQPKTSAYDAARAWPGSVPSSRPREGKSFMLASM